MRTVKKENFHYQNQDTPRHDAREKVDGTILYLDDKAFDGFYGEVVRSTTARGTLRKIVYDPSFDWSEMVIVDPSDIPGKNICPGIIADQPFLTDKEIRFYGEPVALIACGDKATLKNALAHIRVECDPLSPVLTLDGSIKKTELIFGDDNCFKEISIHKKPPSLLHESAQLRIFEALYTTSAQEHLYLEPQGMEATHHEGKIKVSGSMQCPGYVSDALEQASGEKIEVEQTPTGGGFGGKEDYPSLLAVYAYLLALKSQKNVRLIYERSEDIAYTTKRHPAHIAYRGAIDEKGKIQSLSVRFEIDGGAYCTLSPVVLSRGALHCCGLYDIPAIDVTARAMATNTPPSGAFRGFGAPQALFGIERYMDDLARWLGSDPLTLRRQHLPHSTSTTLTGAPIREADALRNVLEKAMKNSSYTQRYQHIKHLSQKERHGIGFALFMHGGGFTGSGEKMLASRVRLEVLKDGSLHIRIINTEMGQGATTVLPEIVADELGIDSTAIHYTTPNTFTCAASGPTVASRTTMVIGNLLRNAAHQLKQALLPYRNSQEFSKAAEHYLARGGSAIFEASFEQPENILWDDEHYKGDAYLGYSLGCYVAEVAIDPISYRARVLSVYALNDIGLPVNETLAESQVHGGILQGVGYALQEELLYHEGRILNARLSDYMIPIAADAPRMEVEFMGKGSTPKGLGELPMSGTGAAIANAVSNALGVPITSLPITPYTIMELLP